ncbi:hypothetical protein ACP4OV_008482 [Aristida adscensionis]
MRGSKDRRPFRPPDWAPPPPHRNPAPAPTLPPRAAVRRDPPPRGAQPLRADRHRGGVPRRGPPAPRPRPAGFSAFPSGRGRRAPRLPLPPRRRGMRSICHSMLRGDRGRRGGARRVRDCGR